MRCLRVVLACAGLIAASAWQAQPASASTFNVLYSFCHNGRFVCADGKNPTAALISDRHGNLYGTTSAGGTTNSGVVFRLTRGFRKYKYEVIHSFECAETCTEGGVPIAPLIVDADGNLYGTATSGGADFGGTAFKLSPDQTHRPISWTYKVLANFCSQASANCIAGMVPESGLTYAGASSGAPYDGVSPLYGTTLNGPTPGAVYALSHNGDAWTGTTLYSFCQQANCADGEFPVGQIQVDPEGKNVFGVTNGGGTENGAGVAYKVSIATGAEAVLHTFCSKADCIDGSGAQGGVTFGDNKTLFGTTPLGGKNNGGTLFTLSAASGRENVVYSFCKAANCTDGQAPNSAPTIVGANLIGTASGGIDFNGVLYQVGQDKSETVLHTFCQEANCADGSAPIGVLVDPAGTIFGVTQRGGRKNDGIVYQLTTLP